MDQPKKSLGQHWLRDDAALAAVVEMGQVGPGETVLEVGPGLGTLTQKLLETGANVIAVEFDEDLAARLSTRLGQPDNLEVINQDILLFDLGELPPGHKIVANIPYYLSGKLIRKILEATSLPTVTSLLVQKEVAERLAARPGQMAKLSVFAQHFCDVRLGRTVEAELFDPPPQVDSQVVGLFAKAEPQAVDFSLFSRAVKAGFAARRKKLLNNLAGGLQYEKTRVARAMQTTGLSENIRAQELSLENWYELTGKLAVD
jgi:16S rRNA (adenine1518-N6/adenine1519-N6)-dimethyltransferase